GRFDHTGEQPALRRTDSECASGDLLFDMDARKTRPITSLFLSQHRFAAVARARHNSGVHLLLLRSSHRKPVSDAVRAVSEYDDGRASFHLAITASGAHLPSRRAQEVCRQGDVRLSD